MKYYEGLMSAYDRGGQTLYWNGFFYTSNGDFVITQQDVRVRFSVNGTAKTNKPFAINIGQKKFIIRPVYNGTICTFDETFLYEGSTYGLCGLDKMYFNMTLASSVTDDGELLYMGTATQGGGDGIVDFGTYILEIEGLA